MVRSVILLLDAHGGETLQILFGIGKVSTDQFVLQVERMMERIEDAGKAILDGVGDMCDGVGLYKGQAQVLADQPGCLGRAGFCGVYDKVGPGQGGGVESAVFYELV